MPQSQYDEAVERARAQERAGKWPGAYDTYQAALVHAVAARDVGAVVDVLRWQGTVLRNSDDIEGALELYEASLAAAEANDLVGRVAAAVNCIGIVVQARGQMDAAAALFRRARDLAELAGDNRLAAMAEQNLGTNHNIRGDYAGAVSSYHSALQHFRTLADDLGATWSLVNLGIAYRRTRDYAAAESCYDDAFALAERLRDMDLIGTVELHRAELFIECALVDRARDACERAYETFARLRSDRSIAEALRVFGRLYRSVGRPHLAIDSLVHAAQLARTHEDPLLEAESETELALAYLALERNQDALRSLNRAHALFNLLDASREIADLELRLDGLEQTYLSVVQRWAESIEEKDQYTAGHCGRVADYACLLAAAIGLEGRDLTWFRMGAFLHDVGKTAVPPEVLNKPGALTPDEWELMKTHTTVGDEIVAELGFPWDIRPIVRSHHERWDGSGYPDGLAAEAIPVVARVLCIADIYDALTTNRSYRPALSQEEALRIMARDAGRIIDPQLFERFRSLIEAGATPPAPHASERPLLAIA